MPNLKSVKTIKRKPWFWDSFPQLYPQWNLDVLIAHRILFIRKKKENKDA